MTSKAPASAALLAQAVGDVAPFLGSSNRPTPTRELSQDEAMLARTEDTPMTPIEKVPNPRPSWTEVLAGPLGSTRRLVAFHLAALVLSTVVRSVAFSPHLGFGNYLLENLAPVERDGVRWPWIVAMRAAEIAAGAALWKRVRGEAKKDGALFGFMLALVSRIPLYSFEHTYFLLSTQTVIVLLVIDTLTCGAAFALLPRLRPHPPAPRPTLSVFDRLSLDSAQYVNLAISVGLATFTAAFGSYVMEHVGLGGKTYRSFLEENVFESTVPSYLLRDQLTTTQVLARPSFTVPTLRTYDVEEHLSMRAHLLHSFLATLPLVPFALSLPSTLLSPAQLLIATGALVSLPSALILWDVLPLSTFAAGVTALGLGIRQGWSVAIVAWTLESLRRTKSVRDVRTTVLVATAAAIAEDAEDVEAEEGGEEGEVVAAAEVVEEVVIEDTAAAAEADTATTSATGTGSTRTSPRKKAFFRGEDDL